MHHLIASPFLEEHLIIRPGHGAGIKIPLARYLETKRAVDDGAPPPTWLIDGARRAWSLDIAERPAADTVLVRTPSPYGYVRASYEINKGRDYDCPHCYLGQKKFEGLTWGRPGHLSASGSVHGAGIHGT
ncbi:hypothetical protein ACWGJX_30745 [Streptomyces sp. NPDC054775]